MKIILYGLGQGLDLVEKKIKKEHEIIGYMDSYSELSVFRGRPFYKVENVCQVSFDYIVITIQERRTAWQVYEMLMQTYELTEGSVLPFYVYANYELHNIKMKEYDLKNIRGLIFGNSHAECGYLEKELSIPFINLSVSAQDIYYNYKIFQKCITDYGERLKGLQYVIIDLYDYCCFNLDASMASFAADYICWGGYLDEHNFIRNPNYQKTFREELFDMSYIFERPDSMYDLFENIDVKRDDLHVLSRWGHIEKKNYLKAGPIIGGVATKRAENTVKENIKLMDLFLQEIKNFNEDIRIIFTLIPRYIEMERATEAVMEKLWKKEFEDVIKNFCNKYNALFWNYKEHQELSKNHMFYYDVEHMNTVGGRALTAILNQDLNALC